MASSVKIAITMMLIIQLTRTNTQSPNLEFLNKLFENMNNMNPVETMIILQHHQDRDCELQDWNHREIPTLRFNQLARVEVRRHFNTQSLGIVCIGRDSNLRLFDTLAEVFDGMRQERIILWIQNKVTHEVLQRISQQAKLYQYVQVLILGVSSENGEILSAHCFFACPNSQIVRVDKMAGFPEPFVDFTGRTANVLPEYEAIVPAYDRLAYNLSAAFHWRGKDHQIILFAQKYNLNLKVIPSPGEDPSALNMIPDILLTSQMSSTKMDVKYLNPFDLSELKVVVPCSRMKTIGDILKQLDIKSSLLYILPVYAAFVAVETIIMLVTHRINGPAYQLTSLNPLLNLRAFRAILGMSFPISRRANPSLRQLFLAISVFGLIFNFWGAWDSYQKFLGLKVLCDSKDLTIIHGMPKKHVLLKNSIYDWPLSKFLIRIQETGINIHWIKQSPYILHKLLNVTFGTKPKRMGVPLRIADFNWLWLLLGCGYGLATFVFIIELTLRVLRKENKGPEPRENVLVV